VSLRVAGFQLGAGKRFLSDTRPAVQTDRVHSELLHTAGRDDTHVHADRPPFGREEAKPPDGRRPEQFEPK